MAEIVHTHEYRHIRDNYFVHPKFIVAVQKLQKALVRDTWIEGNLRVLAGILSSKDKFFDKIARCADFERLFFATGILVHCKEEKRYYFDQQIADELVELARNDERLPVYTGDHETHLASLKAQAEERAATSNVRESILRLVENSSDDDLLVEEDDRTDVYRVGDHSATKQKDERSMHQSTLEDAIGAIELIENEGSHKNLYMVDEDLFIVIKHALIQMRDDEHSLETIAQENELRLQGAVRENGELQQELLAVRALLESASAKEASLVKAHEAALLELGKRKAEETKSTEAIIKELQSFPAIIQRAIETITPALAQQEQVIHAPMVALPESPSTRDLLKKKLSEVQAEHSVLEAQFSQGSELVQQLADEVEDYSMSMQRDFSLAPEQVTEKHLKENATLRNLYTEWKRSYEKIDLQRSTLKLSTLEEKISESNLLIRSLQTLLKSNIL